MTAHELARRLFNSPNYPLEIVTDYDAFGEPVDIQVSELMEVIAIHVKLSAE